MAATVRVKQCADLVAANSFGQNASPAWHARESYALDCASEIAAEPRYKPPSFVLWR